MSLSTKEWFIQYPFDRWQRLRRYPDYRSFCRKYKKHFEEVDHVLVMFNMVSDDTGNDAPLLKIKEQFNLSTVYHYDCDFSPSDLLNIPEIFKDNCAVNPQYSFGSIDSKTTMLSFVKDGHYFDCRINIAPDIPLEEILDGVESFVKLARSETAQKNRRSQFDSNLIAYQIYDLRLVPTPFSKIRKKLNISSVDNTKKKFKTAWRLIRGEKYDPQQLMEAIVHHLAGVEQLCQGTDEWDAFQRIDNPGVKESLFSAKKQEIAEERIQYNTQYTANVWSRIKEVALACIKICSKCGDIECSEKMLPAYDKWTENFNSASDSSPHLFDGLDPCPYLQKEAKEMIIEPSTPINGADSPYKITWPKKK